MEELLPLEAYHALTERTVRRMAAGAGVAFGAIMGLSAAVGIGSAVGLFAGAVFGLVAGGLSGSLFSAFWGSAMLRMRRADDELAHDNDAKAMGESLEHAFRYRMPCSLVDGEGLVPGTLYLDRGRAAFVPVRKLAAKIPILEMALGAAPFHVAPWTEAPWRTRWLLGGVPQTLALSADGRTLRFVTPDAHLAVERLREALPGT